jgi:hypothetical protein
MNPYDNIGTTRLSTSVHDRLCRLAITYQDVATERGIVALRAPLPDLKPADHEIRRHTPQRLAHHSQQAGGNPIPADFEEPLLRDLV